MYDTQLQIEPFPCFMMVDTYILKEGEHFEDLAVDERIILQFILREMEWEVMGWIHFAQERNQWQVLVNSSEPAGSFKFWEYLDWLRNF